LNSALVRVRGIGIAAVIAVLAAFLQSVRLPAILNGPDLKVTLGVARDPHLLTGWLSSALAQHCAFDSACVQHGNLWIFALVLFAIGAALALRPLSLACVAIVSISPMAAALIVDPLGLGLDIDVLLVVVAAIGLVGVRTYPVAARCALAAALALQDPALIPASLVYGSFGGIAPLSCAIIVGAIRLFVERPSLDQIAGPATVVVFGACLFVGGPLLMLMHRYAVFSRLPDKGHALLRTSILAIAALLGGGFSTSGDTAPYWLAGEAALLVGLLISLRTGASAKVTERSILAISALVVIQFALFLLYHGDTTTAQIAYRGNDLLGMLAASSKQTCVARDEVATRYILADGFFLHLYPPRIAPRLVDSAANCVSMSDSTPVVTITGLTVNNWGRAIPLMQSYLDAKNPAGFLQIEGGAVSPATRINTPTGRGAFGNQMDTPLGHVGDFTIISGYIYTPKCVLVNPGEHLAFSAASIPGTPALQVRVTESFAKRSRTILQQLFPASDANAPYEWRRFSVPVLSADCAEFNFSVIAGPQDRYWLTFAGALIR
jgi:hypothetical protein